jgi:glycosyltransferase involved in cell wall biosynthesis
VAHARAGGGSPRVSVVLPVWNAEDTIERAVRSILEQTLTELELVIVDDGSTDTTPKILAGITDERLQVHRIEHQGVCTAANTATKFASAPIIARMDADDIARPDRLARQLDDLKRRELDVVGSQVEIRRKKGELSAGMQRYQRWINEDTLDNERILSLRFVEFPLVNPTLLARRAYFELGFADNAFPEDYDLMLRAAKSGMRFGKTPAILLTWHDSPDRMTRHHDRYSDAAFMNCRRHHFLTGPLDRCSEIDLWGAGATGKLWMRWLQSHNVLVRKLIDVSPRKHAQTIHGVRVERPEAVEPPDGVPLVVAVGADGARQKIIDFVKQRNYTVGGDVWFVA